MEASYRVVERISGASLAETYRGVAKTGSGLVRPVIIKKVHPRFSQDKRFVEMLIREAKATAQIDHPGITQLLDLAARKKDHYIVFEYVEGWDLATLNERCRRSGIPIGQDLVLHVVLEVAGALTYAHGLTDEDGEPLGLVHRDISPTNIMISLSGEVKLTDFALARYCRKVAADGSLGGKLACMSPEQARGQRIDHRSDIFSLGAVLFELALGQPPFGGGDDAQILAAVRSAQFPRPSRIDPQVHSELERILLRALAPAARRYTEIGELQRALRAFRQRVYGARAGRPELAGFLGQMLGRTEAWDKSRTLFTVQALAPIRTTEAGYGDRTDPQMPSFEVLRQGGARGGPIEPLPTAPQAQPDPALVELARGRTREHVRDLSGSLSGEAGKTAPYASVGLSQEDLIRRIEAAKLGVTEPEGSALPYFERTVPEAHRLPPTAVSPASEDLLLDSASVGEDTVEEPVASFRKRHGVPEEVFSAAKHLAGPHEVPTASGARPFVDPAAPLAEAEPQESAQAFEDEEPTASRARDGKESDKAVAAMLKHLDEPPGTSWGQGAEIANSEPAALSLASAEAELADEPTSPADDDAAADERSASAFSLSAVLPEAVPRPMARSGESAATAAPTPVEPVTERHRGLTLALIAVVGLGLGLGGAYLAILGLKRFTGRGAAEPVARQGVRDTAGAAPPPDSRAAAAALPDGRVAAAAPPDAAQAAVEEADAARPADARLVQQRDRGAAVVAMVARDAAATREPPAARPRPPRPTARPRKPAKPPKPRLPRVPAVARPGRGGPKTVTVAPAVRPERPSRRKAFGELVIKADPWAYIYVDGRNTGKVTSAKPLRVPAGQRRIKLVNPALKLEKTLVIEVAEGAVVKKFVPLR